MRIFSRKVTTSILIGIALLAAGPNLTAADDFAELEADSVGMTWNLFENYDMVFLTVSGPNFFEAEYTFERGELPSINLYDERGNLLEDGVYSYQLTAYRLNSSRVFDILARVRQSGDPEEMRLALRTFGDPSSVEVQSGTFAIADRVPFSPYDNETTDQDQLSRANVVPTDQVIQGSECVGLDCSNGESFGFDTLRLKENNLRIHFQDTSNSASFPSVDWRILANETTNGGANLFAIENADAGTRIMTLRSGAGNNAIYVDDAGDVGLNTSNPVVELHVADGDTPTLRLEQTGASGFTPQAWDVASNETNFFIRDVTNGSELPFRIRPGADDSAIDIQANNQIGFGTSSPNAYLHARTTAATNSMLRLESTGFPQVIFDSNDSTNPITWTTGMNAADQNFIFATGDPANQTLFTITKDGDATLLDDLTIDSLIANNTVFANNVSSPLATISTTLTAQTINVTTVTATGTVTADNFVDSSPRGTPRLVETNFLLNQIENMNFYTYSSENGVAFAPNAAEFNSLFGSPTANESKGGISLLNLASSAMAGVKELAEQNNVLTQQLAARDKEIASLQDHAADLEKRLAAIEALLSENGTVKKSTVKAE